MFYKYVKYFIVYGTSIYSFYVLKLHFKGLKVQNENPRLGVIVSKSISTLTRDENH